MALHSIVRKRLSYQMKDKFQTFRVSKSRNASQLAENFYNEEQKELQNSAIKLIETEINTHVEQWERERIFPAHDVFKKFGQAGFLGINKPEKFGGLGLSYKYNMALGEALGYIRTGGVFMGLQVQIDMSTPALSKFGSDQLRKDFLAPAISGDMVTCIGVSEPGGGSDVASVKTNAVRKGDDLVINGQKMWITNSLQADWMCLLANTREGNPHQNKSLIIVPMDTPGVVKAKKIEKMGMHSSDTGLIFFEDVKVPAANIIGEEGMGFTYQMMQFQVYSNYPRILLLNLVMYITNSFHWQFYKSYIHFLIGRTTSSCIWNFGSS